MGAHHEQPGQGLPAGKEEAGGDSKPGKQSFGDKIKAKLHRN